MTEFHLTLRQAGEQIGMLDRYIGDLMAKLTELQIADNTMVVFTSDNGPDRGGFYFLNKMGHLRMGTLRGEHK